MRLTIAPKDILQIDDARICFRNFRGEESTFNAKGARNFSVVIPDMDIAEELLANKNQFGAAWNVKIKAPREEGESPFIHLPVKVKYTERSGPKVYLISGRNRVELTEDTIDMLDEIDIKSVDMDIRPYDDEGRFGPFRSAYLQSLYVVQNVDRFSARFAETDYEEE